MSYCPSQDWDRHCDDQEAAAMGQPVEECFAKLKEVGETRCDAFIHAFGWKDADLEPQGCTGIPALDWERVRCDEYGFNFPVSGHKTIGSFGFDDWPEDAESHNLTEGEWEKICEAVNNSWCGMLNPLVTPEPTGRAWFFGCWEAYSSDAWDCVFHDRVRVEYTLNDHDEVDVDGTVRAMIAAADKVCDHYSNQWVKTSELLEEDYKRVMKEWPDYLKYIRQEGQMS